MGSASIATHCVHPLSNTGFVWWSGPNQRFPRQISNYNKIKSVSCLQVGGPEFKNSQDFFLFLKGQQWWQRQTGLWGPLAREPGLLGWAPGAVTDPVSKQQHKEGGQGLRRNGASGFYMHIHMFTCTCTSMHLHIYKYPLQNPFHVEYTYTHTYMYRFYMYRIYMCRYICIEYIHTYSHIHIHVYWTSSWETSTWKNWWEKQASQAQGEIWFPCGRWTDLGQKTHQEQSDVKTSCRLHGGNTKWHWKGEMRLDPRCLRYEMSLNSDRNHCRTAWTLSRTVR